MAEVPYFRVHTIVLAIKCTMKYGWSQIYLPTQWHLVLSFWESILSLSNKSTNREMNIAVEFTNMIRTTNNININSQASLNAQKNNKIRCADEFLSIKSRYELLHIYHKTWPFSNILHICSDNTTRVKKPFCSCLILDGWIETNFSI